MCLPCGQKESIDTHNVGLSLKNAAPLGPLGNPGGWDTVGEFSESFVATARGISIDNSYYSTTYRSHNQKSMPVYLFETSQNTHTHTPIHLVFSMLENFTSVFQKQGEILVLKKIVEFLEFSGFTLHFRTFQAKKVFLNNFSPD